ncbi:MAG: hypothetical protein ABIR56_17070 [Polaromonas sp.]
MKRFFLLTPLTLAVLLLSGCPDTKLPTPTPKVPEPKAEKTSGQHAPAALAFSPPAGRFASTRLA